MVLTKVFRLNVMVFLLLRKRQRDVVLNVIREWEPTAPTTERAAIKSIKKILSQIDIGFFIKAKLEISELSRVLRSVNKISKIIKLIQALMTLMELVITKTISIRRNPA